MNFIARILAAIVVSGVVVHGTALACFGDLDCQNTVTGWTDSSGTFHSSNEITSYPAVVSYRADFTYSWANDRCAVASLSDSLYGNIPLPSDWKDPETLWVSNPPTATQFREYTVTIQTYQSCIDLGGVVQADESVRLTNTLSATPFYDTAFDCSGLVICRPPPDGPGCTLTPGFWKTHSSYGPAPYAAPWALLGEDSAFFSSGQSFYEVLWSDSNEKYYILARAYIAARLNHLNGSSSIDDVDQALEFADTFFQTYTPSTDLSKQIRAQVTGMAGILDDYNNGLTGPEHCQE